MANKAEPQDSLLQPKKAAKVVVRLAAALGLITVAGLWVLLYLGD